MKEREYSYKDAWGLASWAASFFTVVVFGKLATAAAAAMRIRALLGVEAEKADVNELVQDGIIATIASGDALAWLVAVVLFFAWLYRVSANARALGARGMSQSPCWSYLNFVIPVWRFFKPLSFFRELWQVTASDSPGDPEKWRRTCAPGRVVICAATCFGAFVGSAIVVDALAFYSFAEIALPVMDSGSAEAVEELRRGILPVEYLKVQSACAIVTSLCQLYVAISLRSFIRAFTLMQSKRHEERERSLSLSVDEPQAGFGWPGMRG